MADKEAAKNKKPATYTAIVYFSDGESALGAVLRLEAVKGKGGETIEQKVKAKITGSNIKGVIIKGVTPGTYNVHVPKVKNPKTKVAEISFATGLDVHPGDDIHQTIGLSARG